MKHCKKKSRKKHRIPIHLPVDVITNYTIMRKNPVLKMIDFKIEKGSRILFSFENATQNEFRK